MYSCALLCLVAAVSVRAQVGKDSIEVRSLDELLVKGEKPQVKSDGGVMTVDLPEIVRDKPVTNILESLGYLPGVMNHNGVLTLSGAQSTTILINGEVSQMTMQQLYQLLYSMPVDRLKNVEIMYSAPAKYHVNGAVINVVLKTPSALDGLSGQARAGYSQDHYSSFGGGLAGVYAVDKWTFDLNYSLAKSRSWRSEDMTSWHTLMDGMHVVEDKNRTNSRNLTNQIYASVGYDITKGSVVKATYNGQVSGDIHSCNNSDGTLGKYRNTSDYKRPIAMHDLNLHYRSAFGLTLTADWLVYREERGQLMSDDNNLVMVDAINDQHIRRYRFTADMEHSLNGWSLGYGCEYRLSDDMSLMRYAVPDMSGFHNRIMEHTAKAYVGIAHSFEWGLSLQASLGEEFYRIGGRNNWTFQPQIGLTYYKNPVHIVQASFNTNREFPSYWSLHGGVGYLNPYSEVWGNPSLRPSTSYSANVSYIFRQKYVAAVFFNNTDDYFVQLPYQSADELKLIFQEQNLSYNRMFGFNIVAPFSIGGWFETRVMVQGFSNRIMADRFHEMDFVRQKFVGYGQMQNTFKIAKGISLSVDVSGISRSLQGIADMSAMWGIDVGAKWSFGKSRSCELSLKADDIFNTWSPVMRINYGRQNYRMKVNDMTRKVQLTFVFRFNGFKPKDNGVDTSRFGTSR